MIGFQLANRYRLDAELGQGGMGIVYRGHDILLDRPVAIKILSGSSQRRLGSQGRTRLLHEAQAAARLNHPNIVSIYDAGEALVPGQAEPSPFIVMELLEGHSLYERTLSERTVSLEEILSIARQVCAALEHAHSHGVIHRDLKPENIIVAPDGGESTERVLSRSSTSTLLVKLTDFGLARSIASQLSADGSAGESTISTIVGTVLYLAPESALRQPVDGRADLYSLGVILYELTTGQLPFRADDPLAVISQHIYAPVVPPRFHRPEIPTALDELILELMSKQPERRPASAAEVRQRLEIMESAARMGVAALPPGEPVSIHRLVRGRLVGRERELAEIDAIWQRAAAGEGHTLIVSGESGIGKTRLVRELVAHAAVFGSRVLAGNCYAEGGVPYAPFSQMIRAHALAIPPDSAQASEENLDLPDFVLADLIKISPDVQLGPDLSPNPPLDSSGDRSFSPWLEIERRAEQQRLFESLAAWITALAAKAPILLFVDDIHWADSGTLFLLRSLARRAPRIRLLIVLTYREMELDESGHLQNMLVDLNRERLATRLKLARFDLEHTRQMLETMLSPRGEIDPALVEAIYRETEGNPFFIEEVTKALLEGGKLCLVDLCWAAQDPADLEIPQSVRVAIGSRLARLPIQAQETLRLAAVIGRQFEFDILKESSDLDEDALIDALEIAERAQLINEAPRSRPAAPIFSFEHALIPASLREGMSSLRRQRLHRRVAAALEAKRDEISCCYETLAYHHEQAGDAANALTYYALAGDQALEVSANQEAERHYRAALELDPADPVRARLLSGLGEALFRQSRYREAGETWLKAIEVYRTLGDHDRVAHLYARAGRAAWYAGDAPRGLEICRQGLDVIREMTSAEIALSRPLVQVETHGMAALLHETARACHFNDLQEEALDLGQRALDMARRLDLVDVQADTLATLGLLPNRSYEERQTALTEAVELAENAGLLSAEFARLTAARAHTNLGEFLHKAGDLPAARTHYLRARELARQAGIAAWEHGFIGLAADLSLEMGEYASVESAIQAMRELQPEIPDPKPAAYHTRLFEAHLARLRGEWEQALGLYRQCRTEAEQRSDFKQVAIVDIHLGETFLEMGAYTEAEATLQDVIRRNEARRLTLQSATPLFLLSVVYLHQGRIVEMRAALEKARLYAGTPASPRHQALSEWGEARLAASEKRWQAAFAGYESLVKATTRINAPWHQAHALVEWAEAHLARGETEDIRRASELFEQARAIYTRLEVPNYVVHVEKALAALEVELSRKRI